MYSHVFKTKQMELPIKGKEIKATCSDGEIRYLFRCACKNEKCTEWRCSFSGGMMLVNVVEWEYEN